MNKAKGNIINYFKDKNVGHFVGQFYLIYADLGVFSIVH